MWNEGTKTFKAGEDLEAKRRVKIETGTTTTPPEVIYADAGEDFIGVTEYAVSDGDDVAIKLKNAQGTHEVEVVIDSAIARGTALYGGADGILTDEVSGTAQATAIEAAGADNEHIEVLLS